MELKTEPTVALEYNKINYFRYKSAYKITDKEKNIINIWELESSLGLSNLLSVVITPERVDSLLIVYVLDVSKPKTAMHCLRKWREIVSEHVSNVDKQYGKESKREEITIPSIIVGSKIDQAKAFGK